MKVRLPQLSEKDTSVILTLWHVKEKDYIYLGNDLFEVVTDKATFDIPSPASGRVIKILKKEGDTILPGEVLAEIE